MWAHYRILKSFTNKFIQLPYYNCVVSCSILIFTAFCFRWNACSSCYDDPSRSRSRWLFFLETITNNQKGQTTNQIPSFKLCRCKIYFRLIVPALGSDRIYVVDVKSDPFNPKLDKVTALILYFSFSPSFPRQACSPLIQLFYGFASEWETRVVSLWAGGLEK